MFHHKFDRALAGNLELACGVSIHGVCPLACRPERKQEAAEGLTGGDSGSESAAGATQPDDDCASSTASSGFGSLTKKKNYGNTNTKQYPYNSHYSLFHFRMHLFVGSVMEINKLFVGFQRVACHSRCH